MTDIDNDFQELISVKARKSFFTALRTAKKPFYMQNSFRKPKGWVDLPIKCNETYFDIGNATDRITEWADKQQMILIKKKSTQTTRYLTGRF